MAEAIAIHFKKNFLGTHFFEIDEMKHIAKLLDKAIYGITFKDVDQEIVNQIKNLASLDGYERTMQFIETLNSLAKHKKQQLLASKGFVNSFHKSDKDLNKIYEFIFNNFQHGIGLVDVAKIACMNPSAFSRYFKRVNRKTFTRYLNEIRIGYACKLLMERKFSITNICYESGFNNISNFNRQFRSIQSLSPTEYLNTYK
jgi:AraC-like DNA-binding protein